MLDAIEEVHNRGFIHRDVKAVSQNSFNRALVELCALTGQQASFHRRLWAGQAPFDGGPQDAGTRTQEG
jgi:hypothetical protein